MRSSTQRLLTALLVLLALALIGCASHPKPVRAEAPSVTITQLSRPDRNFKFTPDGGLPVIYELGISNPHPYAVKLVSVEVESVGGSGAYTMKRVRHAFDRGIPPFGSDTIDFRAWVYVLNRSSTDDVDNPVMMRGMATFESESGRTKRAFVARVQ